MTRVSTLAIAIPLTCSSIPTTRKRFIKECVYIFIIPQQDAARVFDASLSAKIRQIYELIFSIMFRYSFSTQSFPK